MAEDEIEVGRIRYLNLLSRKLQLMSGFRGGMNDGERLWVIVTFPVRL